MLFCVVGARGRHGPMGGTIPTAGDGEMETDPEIELAIWYNAADLLDPIGAFGASVEEALVQICHRKNVVCGKISYEILRPGDDRVPPVPRWLEQIENVAPRLLFARTRGVVSSFVRRSLGLVDDLDEKDKIRLRVLTRNKHQQMHPDLLLLTDQQCDVLINQLGMEVIIEQLRSSIVH